MAIPFLATEVSGLADPTYPSGAANKKYVDTISGNLQAQVGGYPTQWGSVAAGTGIGTFGDTLLVSSSTHGSTDSVSVLGYASISGNAAAMAASGVKYTATYDWYAASASKLSEQIGSGAKYTAAYDWYAASASKLSDKASGWASVADTGTIAHGLSAKPSWHIVAPSGNVAFAVATTVDATNISVRISAAGNRMVSWRAEV